MASVSQPDLRALKLKTAIAHRITKELDSYYEELDDNKKKIAEIRASDNHSTLKQMENVLGETQCMIPDTAARLSNAVDDLAAILNVVKDSESIAGSPELERATTVLSVASKKLEHSL